jgi:hypothetical protein
MESSSPKRRRAVMRKRLAIVLALAASSALVAVFASYALAGTYVPFHISYSLVISGCPTGVNANAGYCLYGSGEGTHIGKFTRFGVGDNGTNNAYYFAPTAADVAACPASLGQLRWDYEPTTLTAANGDQINAYGYGYACISGPTSGFIVDGKYAIVGGTGRFAGATGSGTAYLALVKGKPYVFWDGTISSVGSS